MAKTKTNPKKSESSKKKAAKVTAVKKTAGKPKAVAKSTPATTNNDAIERPRRNRTAYMMYVKEHRVKTQEANPEMSFVEVTREVANQWRALSDRERKPYIARAAKDKERYQREVAAFREANPGVSLTVKKKKRTPKLKGPKKARSAYVFYTIEKRNGLADKNPDKNFGELTKMVADGWNKLSEAGKKKYIKLAEADRTRYQEEQSTFNEEHPEVARRRKRRREGAPKKARSAYLYYTMDRRAAIAEEFPDLNFGELTKRVAAGWKDMSDAARRPYEKKAEADRKRFEAEMSNYTPPDDEELDAEEAASKKAKKEGPKRARSAYVYYTMEERGKVQADNPEMKFGEITKILAQQWGGLTDAQKSKYNELATADKARYQREVKAANN